MRRSYLVTYDITNDKRLKKIFKEMKDYGEHLQYSVFLCELNEVERIRMESGVKSIMNEKDDQVIILDLGLSQSSLMDSKIYSLGRPLVFQPRAKIA